MRPLVRIDHREMHTPLARYFQDSTIDFEIVAKPEQPCNHSGGR